MARWCRNKHLKWRTAILVGALSAVLIMAVPGLARAEGFMDLLFGGNQQRRVLPPEVNSYAQPSVPLAPTVPHLSLIHI